MDLPNKDRGCHHTGFARKCRELVVSGECERWTQIQGMNPNTGEQISRHGCIDDWGPMLMIENTQQQRQTGAAVENLRNRVAEANGTNHDLLTAITLHDGRVAPKLIGQG